MLELEFYSNFGFSRPDLDGNKQAKCKCLVRKLEIKKCLSCGTKQHQLDFLNLSWLKKG